MRPSLVNRILVFASGESSAGVTHTQKVPRREVAANTRLLRYPMSNLND